jgi:hypothetical protein
MFSIGDRVYYKDNGPGDTGTIVGTNGGANGDEFQVKWDNDHGTDWYLTSQLFKI